MLIVAPDRHSVVVEWIGPGCHMLRWFAPVPRPKGAAQSRPHGQASTWTGRRVLVGARWAAMRGGRRSRLLCIAGGLVLTLGACGATSAVPDAMDGGSAESLAGTSSFDVCVTRLSVDQALFDLTHPPFDNGGDAVLTIRDVRPPTGLEEAWTALAELATDAAEQGVHPDDVDDAAALENGIQALGFIDTHALKEPCDPTGLPEGFGCGSLTECGERAAEQVSADFATTVVVEALDRSPRWVVRTCSGVTWLQRCELESVEDPMMRADVSFSTTTDDVFFAWTATTVG